MKSSTRNSSNREKTFKYFTLCLENVDLSGNFMTLASGLKRNILIKELNINNSTLKDEDLEILRRMLLTNKTMENLRFKGNNFSSEILEKFLNSLASTENNIRLLDISGYLLTEISILLLHRILENQDFRALFMQNCIQQNQLYDCKLKLVII